MLGTNREDWLLGGIKLNGIASSQRSWRSAPGKRNPGQRPSMNNP